MSDKHTDPEFLANARIVRAQVRRDWAYGNEVRCWRRGCPIEPGQRFDVGHLDPNGGHSRSNLAPECVPCNRSEGGRRGAAITNTRDRARRPRPHRPTRAAGRSGPDRSGLAPW
ncbi:hypothetical protein SAMN04487848_2060 [Microbacterium sp. ru370.1]|uniref:hypothetical protein n=1 Tax=unclassified Microbacterium TaxID=2609290 RepID=UPI00088ECD8E|nr:MULTISPECIES: hypothetical protein [unclassified Microbacterium]SDO77741.1 hypothetical protein SAMN04487848_2060 [Microbacterium sp. ru370.1]SIT88951.1 hypothetical protein SAMN05880579_2055 [Microbacterium sp. RU1D]